MKVFFAAFLIFVFSLQAQAKKNVLFAGSSSIEYWHSLEADFPQYKVTNEGVGGWTYARVAEAMPGFLQKTKYHAVVLYAGDNDIAFGQSPETVLSNFKKLVATIREYKKEILILVFSVKLSPLRFINHPSFRKLNNYLLEESRKDQNLIFVDVQAKMEGQSGIYKDGLHMTPKGYKIWADEVNNAFDRIHFSSEQ